eukprot:1013694-Pelagomonas_calceolata.AAC.5
MRTYIQLHSQGIPEAQLKLLPALLPNTELLQSSGQKPSVWKLHAATIRFMGDFKSCKLPNGYFVRKKWLICLSIMPVINRNDDRLLIQGKAAVN